jgi:hypothetical protein
MVAHMTRRHVTIPVLALALLPAACGGSGESTATTPATKSQPAAAAKPAAIPKELVGTWRTELRESDVPPKLLLRNPFTVTVAADGGIDNSPSFTLADSEEALEGETSTPVFDGDTVTLRHEGCFTEGVGYRFYDNIYRYALSGDTLTFKVVKNACKDRHAEAILTSRVFRRTS